MAVCACTLVLERWRQADPLSLIASQSWQIPGLWETLSQKERNCWTAPKARHLRSSSASANIQNRTYKHTYNVGAYNHSNPVTQEVTQGSAGLLFVTTAEMVAFRQQLEQECLKWLLELLPPWLAWWRGRNPLSTWLCLCLTGLSFLWQRDSSRNALRQKL